MRPFGLVALILFGISARAHAVLPPNDVQMIRGACKEPSHIARGPIGVDLTDAKYHMPYRCDSAVITSHPERGTVLIQFSNMKGGAPEATNIIGFAGPLDAQHILHVERIYIAGSPNDVEQGVCKLFISGAKITSIACGGQVDAGGTRTVPVIAFYAN